MTSQLSILIIEDNKMDQMAFERHLKENRTYSYLISSSVKEALGILKGKRFDVIISDYDLGDGNAFDILQFLISNDTTGNLTNQLSTDTFHLVDQVFIICTGAGDEAVAVKAMKQGASDYFIKDNDFSFLAFLDITVEKALRRLKIEKEIREKNQILNGILTNIPIIVFRLKENEIFSEIIGSGLNKLDLKENDETIIGQHISQVFINLSPSILKAISLTIHSIGHSTNFVGELLNNELKGVFEIYLFSDIHAKEKGAIGFGIDITEKKLAEDKLNQVYQGVQDMFFQLNDSMSRTQKK